MFEDSNPNLGVHDMTVWVPDDAPKHVHNMNSHIANKGGGGTTQVTETGLPEEVRPYVEQSLKDAQTAYQAGALQHVEGLTPEQQDAFNRKLELGQRGGTLDQLAADSYGAAGAYRDAASGTGLFGSDAYGRQVAALEDTIGEAQRESLGGLQTASALGGRGGSARAEAGVNRALTDVAKDIAGEKLSTRRQASLQGAEGVIGSGSAIGQQFGAGISATEGVGSAIQQQKQNEADATYQGLQRIFGLLGSPAVGSEGKTVSSGGGK